MPRNNTPVKIKPALGAIDLHFHGAFGIDLMHADFESLSRLSRKLYTSGVSAFCPTTLSAPPEDLKAAVTRLGDWIHQTHLYQNTAVPLGIHLEGPFLNPAASGAHPGSCVRPFSFQELDTLWNASQNTLKILTMAPELLKPRDLRTLGRWAKDRELVLSIGHTRATQAQAENAIAAGFRNVTHAWNAMAFHQREPGVLGTLGSLNSPFVEVIADQVHVHPSLVRWLFKLAPTRVCCISDCAPSAAMPFNKITSFGPLQVKRVAGPIKSLTSSVTANGLLAGGGNLLPTQYRNWCKHQKATTAEKAAWIQACTLTPLQSLFGEKGAKAWETKLKKAGHLFDWQARSSK